MNENPFSGNYFDMNQRHYAGDLMPMKVGRKLEGTKTSTLMLKPAEGKKGKTFHHPIPDEL